LKKLVRFKVATMVLLKLQVFWDVTLCHWTSISFAASVSTCPVKQQHISEYLNYHCSTYKMLWKRDCLNFTNLRPLNSKMT